MFYSKIIVTPISYIDCPKPYLHFNELIREEIKLSILLNKIKKVKDNSIVDKFLNMISTYQKNISFLKENLSKKEIDKYNKSNNL